MTFLVITDILFLVVAGLVISFSATAPLRREVALAGTGDAGENVSRRDFRDIGGMTPVMLVIYLLGMLFLSVILGLLQKKNPVDSILMYYLPPTLQIGIYFAFLTWAMPYLRKRYLSGTCTVLWVLPNILYIFFYHRSVTLPIFVLDVSQRLMTIVAVIWLIGFLSVFCHGLAEHMRFKKKLFQNAHDVPAQTKALFDRECKAVHLPKSLFRSSFRMPMVSPAITTPLTIGFTNRSIRLMLPEKAYTKEELQLIFRHELVHIGREDAWTKLFLLLCRAVCFFLPTTWIACRRAAEDMELSVDEMVLAGAGSSVREQHAALVLSSASSAEGFTTCLSASAEGIKYRLERILKPEERKVGMLLVAVLSILLLSGPVLFAFAIPRGSGADYLRAHNIRLEECEVADIELTAMTDEAREAFAEQLETAQMYQLLGFYDYIGAVPATEATVRTPEGDEFSVIISEESVRFIPTEGASLPEEGFYLK